MKGKLKNNLRKGHGELFSVSNRNVEIIDKEEHPIYRKRYKVKGYEIWFEENAFEYIAEE